MLHFGKPPVFNVAARGYATLKDIQLRLKSIKNIGKITKSMKMIASTKLNRAQKSMEVGRYYGQTTQSLLSHLNYVKDSGKDYVPGLETSMKTLHDIGKDAVKASPQTITSSTPHKMLLLTCSSDRGLCGGIHSSVSKVTRRLAATDRENVSIAVLGDKAKPQVARDARQNIVMHFSQVGRNIPTFLDALVIWQSIRADKTLPQFEQVAIIYNRFVSAISFESVIAVPPTASTLLSTEKLAAYEYENGVIVNFAEYLSVARLFWALVEGHAAEMSSKRTAMENATKNAEAIVVNLTMKYNRTRQAVITNELVDIITGASAL